MIKIFTTKLTIICIILLSVNQIYSQEYSKPIKLGLNAHRIQYMQRSAKYGFGIEFDYHFSNYFSLNSTIVGGENYFHAPIGTILLLAVAYGGGDGCSGCVDFNFGFYLLLASLSEGIAFHYTVNQFIELAIFVRPFGFEYQKDKKSDGNKEQEFYLTASTGLKYSFVFRNKLYFSPYAEYRYKYYKPEHGIVYGLNISYLFNN